MHAIQQRNYINKKMEPFEKVDKEGFIKRDWRAERTLFQSLRQSPFYIGSIVASSFRRIWQTVSYYLSRSKEDDVAKEPQPKPEQQNENKVASNVAVATNPEKIEESQKAIHPLDRLARQQIGRQFVVPSPENTNILPCLRSWKPIAPQLCPVPQSLSWPYGPLNNELPGPMKYPNQSSNTQPELKPKQPETQPKCPPAVPDLYYKKSSYDGFDIFTVKVNSDKTCIYNKDMQLVPISKRWFPHGISNIVRQNEYKKRTEKKKMMQEMQERQRRGELLNQGFEAEEEEGRGNTQMSVHIECDKDIQPQIIPNPQNLQPEPSLTEIPQMHTDISQATAQNQQNIVNISEPGPFTNINPQSTVWPELPQTSNKNPEPQRPQQPQWQQSKPQQQYEQPTQKPQLISSWQLPHQPLQAPSAYRFSQPITSRAPESGFGPGLMSNFNPETNPFVSKNKPEQYVSLFEDRPKKQSRPHRSNSSTKKRR